jgi:predicted restriction endonuclease
MTKNSATSFKLLSREQFKELSLKRDNYTCVFCSNKNAVVHHIIERKLFSDGGYYFDNAASVCDEHHWACEKTDISVEDVRKAAGITDIILPEGFDPTKVYDKWCNVILPDGRREPGPMFYEDNVQKILKDKIWLFNF